MATTQLHEAIALIQELKLVILGMDGLVLDGAVIVPLDDFIADLGAIAGPWDERVGESAGEAAKIAVVWRSGPCHVELTLDGLDE